MNEKEILIKQMERDIFVQLVAQEFYQEEPLSMSELKEIARDRAEEAAEAYYAEE